MCVCLCVCVCVRERARVRVRERFVVNLFLLFFAVDDRKNFLSSEKKTCIDLQFLSPLILSFNIYTHIHTNLHTYKVCHGFRLTQEKDYF